MKGRCKVADAGVRLLVTEVVNGRLGGIHRDPMPAALQYKHYRDLSSIYFFEAGNASVVGGQGERTKKVISLMRQGLNKSNNII